MKINKKCQDTIKKKNGVKIEKYISSKLLNEVILDIEALKTGNYDIKE